jgi:transposase, IS6 family
VYLYRAIDQYGQVIDVLVLEKRDLAATRRFFARALDHGPRPSEVATDRAPAYPRVLDELLPDACHVVEQYANNPVEADHGRLKARLRPMRSLKRLHSTRVISTGHTFIQNLRRGHYEWDCCIEGRRRWACSSSCAAAAVLVWSSRRDRRSLASGSRGR